MMIFSSTNGTVTISRGCVLAKASMMILGDGTRVRKCRWHPFDSGCSISIERPNMCASGSMQIVSCPGPSHDSLVRAKAMFDEMAR